jgi:hypothetical protein
VEQVYQTDTLSVGCFQPSLHLPIHDRLPY